MGNAPYHHARRKHFHTDAFEDEDGYAGAEAATCAATKACAIKVAIERGRMRQLGRARVLEKAEVLDNKPRAKDLYKDKGLTHAVQ